MIHDLDFRSEGVEITVTSKATGKSAVITLEEGHKRWMVKAKGFNGYYSTLEHAVREVAELINGLFGREE